MVLAYRSHQTRFRKAEFGLHGMRPSPLRCRDEPIALKHTQCTLGNVRRSRPLHVAYSLQRAIADLLKGALQWQPDLEANTICNGLANLPRSGRT